MTKFIVLPLIATSLGGTFCRAEEGPAKPSPAAAVGMKDGRLLGKETIFAAIKDRFFVSWGGEFQGQDCDYAFRFGDSDKVTVTCYVISVASLDGSYKIDGQSGEISVTVKDLPGDVWPKMIVTKEGEKAVLHRADGKTHFFVPADHNQKGEPRIPGFWPFREKAEIP